MKRRMEQKSKNAISISIIGGADGPTSIFIAGPSEKQPLKVRIKNSIYRYKRKKVEKTIVANPHSLSETVQYAKEKYGLTETAPGNREYIEQIKCLKESLILQHEPELLGEMKLELEERKETGMRLALVQMPNYGSKDENLYKSLQAIEIASKQEADLVLFPEVQLTEFFPQYPGQDVHKYAVTIEGETVKKFCDICRNNKISAVPNLYLLENDRTYDASIFIDKNGEVKGTQKMVHIAQAEQFYEQDYYTPSDEGFKVFDTEFGKIGLVVCFDRHYPESIRTEVLRGAELILIPTVNTKAEPSLMFEWELRVQAFQNSVILAMCNRVGTEGNMCFSGESIVVDAKGDILAKADDTEQILYVDIDMQESLKIRNAKPYTQLRRPDFYL